MSKYSSDSDSSSYQRRSRRKRRSSSSSCSDSSRRRKSKSSKHHRSSRYKKGKSYSSRNYRSHSKSSSRRSRSSSKDIRCRRSRSRDKYRRKHHYSSGSHSKSSKYRSRSTSSDSKTSSSSSTSKSSSKSINKKNTQVSNSCVNPEEQLREKLLKAIKAAESADHQLKQQGVLPKGVKSRNDISNLTNSKPHIDVIKDINSDSFVSKSFTSSKHKVENLDDIPVPAKVEVSDSIIADENSIFHSSFFIDPKSKLDRWVKKLYQIRQRAISGEPIAS